MTNPINSTPAARHAMGDIGNNEISLAEVWDLVRAGRYTVFKVACAVLLLMLALIVLWPPSYQSTGVIQIDETSGQTASGNFGQGAVGSILLGAVAQTAAEIELMQSRAVVDPVIAQLKLDIQAEPSHFPIFGNGYARKINGDAAAPVDAPLFMRYWAWGGERIVVDSLDVPANVLDTQLSLKALGGGRYRLMDFWHHTLLEGRVGEAASSRDGRYKIRVQTLDAQPGTHFAVTRWAPIDAYSKAVSAMSVAEQATAAGVVSVSYRSATAKGAQAFVDALLVSYMAHNSSRRADEAQRSLKFLEAQLPEFSQRMQQAQQRLAEYQQAHDAPDIQAGTSILLQSDAALEQRRLSLKTQLDRVSVEYGPAHMAYRKVVDELASVERQQTLSRQRIRDLPPVQQDLVRLSSDAQAYTQLYQSMVSSIQNFQVSKAGAVGNVRVVDVAGEPHRPVFPQPLVMLVVAVVLGPLAGFIWLFFQRALLRGVDSPQGIERVTGLGVMACVPETAALTRAARRSSGDTAGVLAVSDRHSPLVDHLRVARLAVLDALRAQGSHVVLASGAAPGAGCTTLLSNLAVLLAQAGRSVVLVDADLRSADLSRSFGIDTAIGMSDFISDVNADPARLLQNGPVQGLQLLGAGLRREMPADALLHPRAKGLIQLLSNSFDCVLIDAASLSGLGDAAPLAPVVSTLVLVVEAAAHRPAELQGLLLRLRQQAMPTPLLLLNRVGRWPASYGYRGLGLAPAAVSRTSGVAGLFNRLRRRSA